MNTKSPIATVCTFAVTLLFAFPVLSQNAYFQIDGGAAFLGNTDLGDGVDAEYDVGWTAGARLGGNLSESFRVELEVSYSENDFDSVDDVDLSAIGADDEDTGFTAHGEAGLSLQVTPNITGGSPCMLGSADALAGLQRELS